MRSRLRERLGNTRQAIVLLGPATKYLYRFVRWELEMCLSLGIPLTAVNLTELRQMDPDRCPPIIRDEYVVHVSFKMTVIRQALDGFPGKYFQRQANTRGPSVYNDSVYAQLGL